MSPIFDYLWETVFPPIATETKVNESQCVHSELIMVHMPFFTRPRFSENVCVWAFRSMNESANVWSLSITQKTCTNVDFHCVFDTVLKKKEKTSSCSCVRLNKATIHSKKFQFSVPVKKPCNKNLKTPTTNPLAFFPSNQLIGNWW